MEKTLMQAFTHVGIGKKDGQDLQSYAKEIKALSAEDRAYFAERFAIEFGIKIVATPGAAAS